jgi:hypothetical protein
LYAFSVGVRPVFDQSAERCFRPDRDVSVVVTFDHVSPELSNRYIEVVGQSFPYIVVARRRSHIQVAARNVTTPALEANVQHGIIPSFCHLSFPPQEKKNRARQSTATPDVTYTHHDCVSTTSAIAALIHDGCLYDRSRSGLPAIFASSSMFSNRYRSSSSISDKYFRTLLVLGKILLSPEKRTTSKS